MFSIHSVTIPAVALLVAAGAVMLTATPAAFGETPARVRGTVTAVGSDTITVQSREGQAVTLKTGSYTTYANVVPSSLNEINVDDFVGSAVKGPLSALTAVEVAIVPESMRAGRIGFYDWDPLADPTAKTPPVITPTNMTNGLVSKVSPAGSALTGARMTNGTVSAEKSGPGGRLLTVTYDSGSKILEITVPPNAPVVRYVLADRSAAVIGSTVMVKTNPGDQAGLVTIGKGVTPPM